MGRFGLDLPPSTRAPGGPSLGCTGYRFGPRAQRSGAQAGLTSVTTPALETRIFYSQRPGPGTAGLLRLSDQGNRTRLGFLSTSPGCRRRSDTDKDEASDGVAIHACSRFSRRVLGHDPKIRRRLAVTEGSVENGSADDITVTRHRPSAMAQATTTSDRPAVVPSRSVSSFSFSLSSWSVGSSRSASPFACRWVVLVSPVRASSAAARRCRPRSRDATSLVQGHGQYSALLGAVLCGEHQPPHRHRNNPTGILWMIIVITP